MMIKVGDIIKALDFPHTDKFYMIGRVVDVDEKNGYIYCDTIKQVSDGKEVPIDDFNSKFATVPLGGHFMEAGFISPRITVLG